MLYFVVTVALSPCFNIHINIYRFECIPWRSDLCAECLLHTSFIYISEEDCLCSVWVGGWHRVCRQLVHKLSTCTKATNKDIGTHITYAHTSVGSSSAVRAVRANSAAKQISTVKKKCVRRSSASTHWIVDGEWVSSCRCSGLLLKQHAITINRQWYTAVHTARITVGKNIHDTDDSF